MSRLHIKCSMICSNGALRVVFGESASVAFVGGAEGVGFTAAAEAEVVWALAPAVFRRVLVVILLVMAAAMSCPCRLAV